MHETREYLPQAGLDSYRELLTSEPATKFSTKFLLPNKKDEEKRKRGKKRKEITMAAALAVVSSLGAARWLDRGNVDDGSSQQEIKQATRRIQFKKDHDGDDENTIFRSVIPFGGGGTDRSKERAGERDIRFLSRVQREGERESK